MNYRIVQDTKGKWSLRVQQNEKWIVVENVPHLFEILKPNSIENAYTKKEEYPTKRKSYRYDFEWRGHMNCMYFYKEVFQNYHTNRVTRTEIFLRDYDKPFAGSPKYMQTISSSRATVRKNLEKVIRFLNQMEMEVSHV